MSSILETFQEARPASIQIGYDDKLHFVDAFGDPWCESGVELTGEIVEDDEIDAMCPECRTAAQEEEKA